MAEALHAVVRYADDAAGLEKSLRLLQALFQIAGGMAVNAAAAAPWLHVRSQLALGRRYFRLLKWQPCWAAAVDQLYAPQPAWRMLLQVLKFSLVGMYFFLEAWTITNALGVTAYAWGPVIQNEANKCWAYSIMLSIIITVADMLGLGAASPPARPQSNTKANPKIKRQVTNEKRPQAQASAAPPPAAAARRQQQTSLYKQLVIDVCDLAIPGSAVGWVALDLVTVGALQSISSAVAGRDIWMRVQAAA